MGCTSSAVDFDVKDKQPQQTLKARSLVKIEYLDEPESNANLGGSQNQKTNEQMLAKELKNRSITLMEQKIQFLKESKRFMDMSIETSNYVNSALKALSENPLLYDHTYTKLIGMNKKSLDRKQNRFNNLTRREEKAQHQLKKQKQLFIQKSRSQYFRKGSTTLKKPKKVSKQLHKTHNKQNRTEPTIPHLSQQRFSQKLGKMQLLLAQARGQQ